MSAPLHVSAAWTSISELFVTVSLVQCASVGRILIRINKTFRSPRLHYSLIMLILELNLNQQIELISISLLE